MTHNVLREMLNLQPTNQPLANSQIFANRQASRSGPLGPDHYGPTSHTAGLTEMPNHGAVWKQ